MDSDEYLPEKIKVDKERLTQVIMNLLGNSLKFTRHGTITLGIHVVPINADYCLRFQVQDTGIGIPQSRLNDIFNLFEVKDKDSIINMMRDKKSAKFGLPISQNLCKMMGTSLNCKSQEDKGS